MGGIGCRDARKHAGLPLPSLLGNLDVQGKSEAVKRDDTIIINIQAFRGYETLPVVITKEIKVARFTGNDTLIVSACRDAAREFCKKYFEGVREGKQND